APAVHLLAATAFRHEAAGGPAGRLAFDRVEAMQVAARVEQDHLAWREPEPDTRDTPQIKMRGVIRAINHAKRTAAVLQIENLQFAAGFGPGERKHKRKKVGADLRHDQPIAVARRLLIVEMRRDEATGQV